MEKNKAQASPTTKILGKIIVLTDSIVPQLRSSTGKVYLFLAQKEQTLPGAGYL